MFLPQNFSVPSVVAGGQKPQKKEFYFEQTDYLSNSDLSRLDSMSRGVAYREPPRNCFEFGRAFDCYVTEHSKYNPSDYDLQPHHFEQIQKMAKLYSYRKPYRAKYQVEVYNEAFKVPQMVLKAKCKIDIKAYNHIYDLKTTTCSTLREFYKKIFSSYAYDRAAAWYLDVANAQSYTLIVCNYTNDPEQSNEFDPQIWEIEFTRQMLAIGRGEYMRILKYAKENNLITLI